MSELKVQNLRRTFGSVVALEDMSFDVHEGEFFCLLGPSSSGKTTTLRSIAGLEQLDKGKVHFAGQNVTNAPVQGRGMSMIFQTFALYPHLSVEANFAHPLRRSGVSSSEVKKRVGEVAELLRVTHTLKRKPSTLSGGEQQRVAIARAVLKQPSVLLFDEATSSLDTATEANIQANLEAISQSRTTIIVAHRLSTVIHADRILVLDKGVIVESGTHDTLIKKGGLYARLWQARDDESVDASDMKNLDRSAAGES